MHTILLTSPPSRVANHYRPPLALMYLSGYLKRNGIHSQIIDITLKEQIRNNAFLLNKAAFLTSIEQEILRRIMESKANIIGLTCYTPEFQEISQLASKIKTIKPDSKIIVGGIHPTLYPEDFLGQDKPFDFVVIGEGELTLKELCEAINNKKDDLAQIKGIGYYDPATSQKHITESRPLVENLDDIIFPDYDDLDMGFYTNASPYSIRGVFVRSFYISSSRGCPSSCVFCVSKKLRDYHGVNRFVRLRTPASIYQEIRTLQEKHKIDAFYFIDDLFTLKKENVYAFCEFMIKNRSSLIWGCSSRVNTVDYALLKVMRDAGCVQIDFGVEKGSDEALRMLKKGITITQIKKTFSDCRKLKIRTFANILVNTPEETYKDLLDIIGLIETIKPNILSINVFTPYPGCEIYDTRCQNISQKDYSLLMEDPNTLIERFPQKFRFAKHNIDLRGWGVKNSKRYNRILPNISFFADLRYLRCLAHSRNKINYIKQIGLLLKEFMMQKF